MIDKGKGNVLGVLVDVVDYEAATAEILAAARERLGNDEAAERVIVADELRRIARLRLERMLDALG